MAYRIIIAAILCTAISCTEKVNESAGLPASTGGPCRVVADERLEKPMNIIVGLYRRASGSDVVLTLKPAAKIENSAGTLHKDADVVVSMPEKGKEPGPVGALPGAKQIAWTHPKGVPVNAVALTKHPDAGPLVTYAGGPEGHRKWAEANFRIATGKTPAEAYDWVVRNRTKKTYPMTAVRMLRECGVRDGLCIDVGCGSGLLDVELAKRSNLKIIGLDIDKNVKPLFEKYVREAGMEKRLSIVIGDAQKMPFPDNYADVIVSRGTLTFIPDIGKCLREVERVMKPTGVAFLGGRYLYTPQKYKITTEKLRKIVAESGVKNAKVIDFMGQWVKIIGPEAPKAAHGSGTGPHMLVGRVVSNYGINEGDCLILGKKDSAIYKGTKDFIPDMKVKSWNGKLEAMPFEDGSFDMIVGAGPMLLFSKDRPKAMSELYRLLRPGGVAFVGGRFLGMPARRRVPSDQLRKDAEKSGVKSIRVLDRHGKWVEVRKGIKP